MAQYPSLKDDRVLYERSDVFADRDIKITLLDGSILDVWGSVFVNGNPISLIGSIPIATQAEAEAGVSNTAVMTPLRTAQAIDVQAVDKTLVDAKGDLLVATANDVVARLPVGTDGQYLQADSAQATGTKWAAATAVVADGDKGDIVVSGSGTSWMLDSTVVTTAAKTVLDDTSTAAMLTTLGGTTQGYVDTQVATKQPLDSDLTTIAGLTATTDNVIQAVASAWASRTPAQLKTTLALTKTDVGLSNVDNTSDITKPLFTTTVRGDVPPPGTVTGAYLKDDGTWVVPPGAASGIGGVFSFMYSTTTTEPPTGSQLRGNNATFTSSTKLWVMEQSVDGLDVSLGLSRIKTGAQVYIQDYSSAARYALFNVTADATDKGAYWEITVSLASSLGTVPAGKIAFQRIAPTVTLSSLGGQPLDSDLTTIASLTATTDNIIQAVAGAWASRTPAQVKTALSLNNVDNTSDATQDAATSTLTNKTLTDPKINLAINAQTGTTYTLVLTDSGKLVTCSNAAAITLTVPPNSSVAFPVGAQITIAGIGVGLITVAQGSGVTVNATPSLVLRARYSGATLIKTATDTWLMLGDMA